MMLYNRIPAESRRKVVPQEEIGHRLSKLATAFIYIAIVTLIYIIL